MEITLEKPSCGTVIKPTNGTKKQPHGVAFDFGVLPITRRKNRVVLH